MLTEPDGRGGAWEEAAFLRTGEEELAAVMETCDRHGLPGRRRRALDFGCGVGRVTRPMSLLFEECRGVDIAESMLAAARELTADRPNCTFDLAEGDGLPRYADGRFDFVYSSRVLQHLPSSRAIHRLIGELLRVLAPGGVLVFQLPAGLPLRRRLQPRRRAYAVLRSIGLPAEVLLGSARLNPMVVLGVAASEVEATVELHGGRIIETVASMIPGTGIRQSLYFVTGRDERPGAAGNPA